MNEEKHAGTLTYYLVAFPRLPDESAEFSIGVLGNPLPVWLPIILICVCIAFLLVLIACVFLSIYRLLTWWCCKKGEEED